MAEVEVPFRPFGAARLIFDGPHCRARELLLAGPAGGGKTRSALEKVHLCCLKYPGTRALMARKHKTDLVAAALQTFKDFVLHERDGVVFVGASGDHPGEYRYPRKDGKESKITIGGLDKDAKNIMSREFDLVYLQEAVECSENDWENLLTRLRGVAMPYSQIIADCNPTYPTHWLKQRADKGVVKMHLSTHKDNPLYWDEELQQYTPRGRAYVLETLGALTGHRRARLLEGKWVAAEGQVYPMWDPEVHVIEPRLIPDSWPRYHVVDFGHTNPFFYGWLAEDPDGRIYLYRQVYYSHRIVEDHARMIKKINDAEPTPQIILCDHDAEDRMTLERYTGLPTTPADKAPNSVRAGIESVQARLRVQPDGKPRFYVMRTDPQRRLGLVERDPYLEQVKKPICTEEEFDSYVWSPNPEGVHGEEPVKRDDHAMDGIRYLLHHLDAGSPMSWVQDDDPDNWYDSPEFDHMDPDLAPYEEPPSERFIFV